MMFFVTILLLAFCAWLAAWSRTRGWARVLTLAAFLAGTPAIAAMYLQALGHPKDLKLTWELRGVKEVKVLGFMLVQDVAIYVYIEGDPPLSLQLPWDNKKAQQLKEASDAAKSEEGDGTFYMFLTENSLNKVEPEFKALPVPKLLPPKTQPTSPYIYIEPSLDGPAGYY